MANPGNRTYACRRGAVRLAVENAAQWRALAVCLGRPELAYEGSWEAVREAAADGPVAGVVGEMLAEDDAGVWLRRFEAHGVPCEAVSTDR